MIFKTIGDKINPAVLFFHALGVTGENLTYKNLYRQLSDSLTEAAFPKLSDDVQKILF